MATPKMVYIQGHYINPRRISYVTGYLPITIDGKEHSRSLVVFTAGERLDLLGKPEEIVRVLLLHTS